MQTLFLNGQLPDQPAKSPYRFIQGCDRYASLGRAVEMLSQHKVGGQQSFTHLADTLMDHIDRGQYAFVMRDQRPVGFVGWVRTDKQSAERWLMFGEDVSELSSPEDPAIVLDTVQVTDRGALSFIYRHVSKLVRPPFVAYAKRCYPYGRTKPIRMDINSAE